MNYCGTIFMDYESEDEEAHYRADVKRAVLDGGSLVLEFSGSAPDEGKYKGECRLRREGGVFEGTGEFRAANIKLLKARVRLNIDEETSDSLTLKGTWLDDGDKESYQVEIELASRRPAS